MLRLKRRRPVRNKPVYPDDLNARETLQPLEVKNENRAHEEGFINNSSIELPWNHHFASHVSRYAGQTVTVFVTAGGLSGLGFTGILLNTNDEYIELLVRVGPAPACALNKYKYPNGQHLFYPSSLHNAAIRNPGSIAVIPIVKIASFVHNAL